MDSKSIGLCPQGFESPRCRFVLFLTRWVQLDARGLASVPQEKTTPVGFEPTRGDPIGLAGRRLNRSAKVSLLCSIQCFCCGL